MRTASQNGKRSRDKGHAWEREVAILLRPIWPDAERNIAQSRTAKREGCDVEKTPYWIECKVGAVINLAAAYAQAEADSDGREVIVIAKADRRRPVVYGNVWSLTGLGSAKWADLMVTADLEEWLAGVGVER